MSYAYARAAKRRLQLLKALTFKGETITITIDYSAWADDNGAVSSVTASLEYGQASIANESLVSNVKSMTVTTAEIGSSLIKLSATAGNNIDVIYLYVYCKEPTKLADDYGLWNG